jgi:hypothetical protein
MEHTEHQCCVHDESNYDDELIVKRYRGLSVTINMPEPEIWRRQSRKLADSTSSPPEQITAMSGHDMLSRNSDSGAHYAVRNTGSASTAALIVESRKIGSLPLISSRPVILGQTPEAAIKFAVQSSLATAPNSTCPVIDGPPPSQPSTGPVELDSVVEMDNWAQLYLSLMTDG